MSDKREYEYEYKAEEGWLGSLGDSLSERLGPLRSPFVWGGALLVVLLAAAIHGWRTYGPQILENPQYQLSIEQIEITPQPKWIRANVRAEVVRDGSLTDLRLTDRELLEKIADAFAVHSWIANVSSVRKSASKIVVQLEYRRPVAMVEVPDGLVPVDAGGVILPTEDFHPDTNGDNQIDASELAALERRIRPYPRLRVFRPKSYGVEGTPWGDRRVHESAAIAAAWGEKWPRLGLYRVVAAAVPESVANRQVIYELESRAGAKVIWGYAIGQEQSGEPSASEKIERLVSYVRDNGALDTAPSDLMLDLRSDQLRLTSTAARARNSEPR